MADVINRVLHAAIGKVCSRGFCLASVCSVNVTTDRLFIFAALIGLAIRDVIPWWLFIVIVARDVVLLGFGILGASFGYGPLPVHHLGKVATAALFYALPILMLGQAIPETAWIASPIGWAFALWGAFLYWWAGGIYFRETVRLVQIPRLDEPAPSDTLVD